jgi:hypothetical protein
LLLNYLYGADPLRVAPIELLLSATAAALMAWRRASMQRDSLDWAAGLTLATSAYLLLWPMLGFRLSGVDFHFMFEWVPKENYEAWWWLIALGALAKFVIPYLLLGSLAAEHLDRPEAGQAALSVLLAKVLVLAAMISSYAIRHSTASQSAVDMLAELALVTLALPWVASWTLFRKPSRDRAAERTATLQWQAN